MDEHTDDSDPELELLELLDAQPAPEPASPGPPRRACPHDPAEALAENDACRRADVGFYEGLWTADEAAALRPPTAQEKRLAVPTFFPPGWAEPRLLPRQEEYTAEFARRHPLAAQVLCAVNRASWAARREPAVVVAGGAAAAPFYPGAAEAGDVDFFVVGVDPADEDALWRAADSVGRELVRLALEGAVGGQALFPPRYAPACVAQHMIPGLVSVTLMLAPGRPPGPSAPGYTLHEVVLHKYQIILRAFPSVSALLHGFDVPACCAAFDGRTARVTTLGLHAQRFRVNLVNPAYRSTTYERRLVKYFLRGYALGLVGLAPGALRAGARLALPHLALMPAAVRGLRAEGQAEALAGPDPAVSDYEPAADACLKSRLWSQAASSDADAHAGAFMNLARLAARSPAYAVVRCSAVGVKTAVAYPWATRVVLSQSPGQRGWLGFSAWHGSVAGGDEDGEDDEYEAHQKIQTLGGFLSRPQLISAMKAVSRGIYCAATGAVNLRRFMKYFGADAETAARFGAGLQALAARHPGRAVDLSESLEPFWAEILRRYAAARSEPVEWWVRHEPGRQWTASLNPRVEDPAAWYGAAAARAGSPAPPPADGGEDGEPEAPVFDSGQCPLCLLALRRGAANSVILACGHVFHWAFTGECGGLRRWVCEQEEESCPCCRGRMTPAEARAAAADTPPPRPVYDNTEPAPPPGSPIVYARSAS